MVAVQVEEREGCELGPCDREGAREVELGQVEVGQGGEVVGVREGDGVAGVA